MKRLPDGAEVHSAKSKTLEDIGVFAELMESDRYDFLRKKLSKMDRATQAREMRRLVAAPDVELGSVHAITEAGELVEASATGSQMGPYSASSGQLILVVGSQKIVKDLDAALRRIREHVFPYEDARLREQMGVGTKICRVLILEQDYVPGHTTVVLVREPVGV
jgi:LUD domain